MIENTFAGFYYYGRKKAIVEKFPLPEHDVIIEPFAGAAAYACRWPSKQVILIDKDPKIVQLWEYLINATKEDIDALPILTDDESLKDAKFKHLCPGAKLLIGYHLGLSSHPYNKPTRRNKWHINTKQRIADSIHLINHWQIVEGNYDMAPDIVATWFVDPPYCGSGGLHYTHNNTNIDYTNLGLWVQDRKGQAIACDKSDATWMPFACLIEKTPINHNLKNFKTNSHEKYIEGVWIS